MEKSPNYSKNTPKLNKSGKTGLKPKSVKLKESEISYKDKDKLGISNDNNNSSQKITVDFSVDNNTVVFSSAFDSGNMKSVKQLESNQPIFNLEVAADCEDLGFQTKNRGWFFFSVTFNHQFHKYFNFNIINILNQSKYYNEGYKIVYYVVYKSDYHAQVPIGFQNEYDLMWKRLDSNISSKTNQVEFESKPYTEIGFEFKAVQDYYSVYFSFCYPYSYTRIIKFCENLNAQLNPNLNQSHKNSDSLHSNKNYGGSFKSNLPLLSNNNSNNNLHHQQGKSNTPKSNIYFHKETVTYSPQNRKLELITLSSYDMITTKKELSLKGLFPSNSNQFSFENSGLNSISNRCYAFSVDKPIIFITARVHPAETMSSYVLEGILNFLTDLNDLRAIVLRKFFVFKIIPVINPDGVANGYYRFDTNGFNLNRHYVNPDPHSLPEVYAIKRLFIFYSQQFRVKHFFDLHGHFSTKGHFVFMNHLDFMSQIESLSLAVLLAIHNKGFIYKSCVYGEKSMKSKEHGDKFTKEGSSRVYFYKTTGIINSYTLEASAFKRPNANILNEEGLEQIKEDFNVNYLPNNRFKVNFELLDVLGIDKQHGFVINNYEQKFDLSGNFIHQQILKEDISKFFTIQCYHKLSVDLMNSILDYEEINPLIKSNKEIPFELGLYPETNFSMKDIRIIISNKLLKEDEKFKYNTLNKAFATNLEEARKKTGILDRLLGKHKKQGGNKSSIKSAVNLNYPSYELINNDSPRLFSKLPLNDIQTKNENSSKTTVFKREATFTNKNDKIENNDLINKTNIAESKMEPKVSLIKTNETNTNKTHQNNKDKDKQAIFFYENDQEKINNITISLQKMITKKKGKLPKIYY